MAQLVVVGQHAYGVIAIGQEAVGVIAIGQIATGVIAIGQVARGVFAVGMASIGLVSVGMVSLSVMYGGGIMGVAGRPLFGFMLSLTPQPLRNWKLPRLDSLASIRGGNRGWLRVRVARTHGSSLAFAAEGQSVPLIIQGGLLTSALKWITSSPRNAIAYVSRRENELLCRKLTLIPHQPYTRWPWYLIAVGQLVALVAAAALVWHLAFVPVGDALMGAGGILR